MTRPTPILLRPITAAEARPVRQAVLRPDQPPETTVYPGDDAPGAWHVGAFVEGALLGIASVYIEAPAGTQDPCAYRLRGMAVLPGHQGRGYGRALVQACLRHVRAHGGHTLWCNGRVSALGFYQALGFEPVGEVFDLPYSGAHYRLVKRVRM
jgi:GNAT superfamily N-acetyltransferase